MIFEARDNFSRPFILGDLTMRILRDMMYYAKGGIRWIYNLSADF